MTADTFPAVAEPSNQRARAAYVLFFWHVVSERDLIRFGRQEFESRGYDAHFISCWNAIHENDELADKNISSQSHKDVWSPATRAELENFCRSLPPRTFVQMAVPLIRETAWLFELLTRYNLRYCYASLAKYPNNYCIENLITRKPLTCAWAIAREIKRAVRWAITWGKLIRSIGPSYFRLNGPSIYARAGNHKFGYSAWVPFLSKAAVIDVESFDKCWARLAEGEQPPVDTPYAVLLDDAMSHHPDWSIEGGKPEDMAKIQADLSYALDRIETDTQLPVVIALHPKADYPPEEARKVFGTRPQFKDKTAVLVREASLVIGHASTALSMPVIFGKSTLCLTSPRLRGTRDGLAAEFIASWLNTPPLDIAELRANPDTPVSIPPIDQTSYKRYHDRFIASPGAAEGSSWRTIAERFEQAGPS